MGSKTAADAKQANILAPLVNALARHIQDLILPGETPIDGPKVEEAARFLLETGLDRAEGASAVALGTMSEGHRFTRVAVINEDMPFLVDFDRRGDCRSGPVD